MNEEIIQQKYEILQKEWLKDSKINSDKLDEESLKIPELHSKYYNTYIDFMSMKRKLKAEYQTLLSNKERWYLAEMDLSEMKEYNWQPFPKKVLKVNLQSFLDKDSDLIKLALTIGKLDDITDFIKSVLDVIVKRNFQISNAINWQKFKKGVL